MDAQHPKGPVCRQAQDPDPAAQDALISAPGTIHLRLLATSDLHVHILPHDYYSGLKSETVGLARTATLIARARAEAVNCLLFDNGDFLQGSPLGDFTAQSQRLGAGAVHPMLSAMNHLHYDAGVLGNHEFSHGLDFLTTALAGANFPVLSANVFRASDAGKAVPLVPPYTLLERTLIDERGKPHHIKIGVIGFTPPQIMTWDHDHLSSRITTQDIVTAARACIPKLQRKGADMIIALSHSGIGSSDWVDGMENASTALAAIAGIDVIIAGHSHLVFPSSDFACTDHIDALAGTLCGKPAVMPGFYGSHLGVIDLCLSPQATGFAIRSHRVQARPIWHRDEKGQAAGLVPDHPGIVEGVSKAHEETLAWANRAVGASNVPLHSYFSLVTQSPATALVAAAQAHHVAETLAKTDYASLPVLASVAPFKAGGRGGPDNYTDVPAGEILQRHAADLYMHPNTSAALRMTGAELETWLEFAVGLYNQIEPGRQDQPLINPDFPSFNFDMLRGLGFQIDLSQPAMFDVRGAVINPKSRRISNLDYAGEPVDPKSDFVVATNSHRVATSSGLLAPAKNRIVYRSTISNRDVLLRFLAQNNPWRQTEVSGWRFCAMPGTTAVFDSAPNAVAHLARLPALRIDQLDMTKTGFMRFRLHL